MLAVLRTGVLAVGLAGCQLLFDLEGPPPDAPDVPDVPDVPECYGRDVVQICLVAKPTSAIDLAGEAMTTIDTDGSMCAGYTVAGGEDPEACVLAGLSVRIANPLRAIGGRSLVIVSATSIEVSSAIDVSSRRDNRIANVGAGAIDSSSGPLCKFAASDFASGGAGGGGPGGSFGSLGGDGGNASDAPGTGGVAMAASALDRLRGGCRGGGGSGTIGSNGPGGGAIALVAITTIVVTTGGSIDASGASGLGGDAPLGSGVGGGGGGGGSGGMILLDGTLTSDGVMFANGGGGGEGGGNSSNNDGCDGASSPAPAEVGTGGAGCTVGGGDGGDGGFAAELPERGVNGLAGSSNGGGGGGGSVGVIKVFPAGQIVGGQVSPPPI